MSQLQVEAEQEVDQCQVCQEDILGQNDPQGAARPLQCGHVFHQQCIAAWLMPYLPG